MAIKSIIISRFLLSEKTTGKRTVDFIES